MKRKNESGFTLIELLVAISIIGILAATTVNSMGVIRQLAYDKIADDMLHNTEVALTAGLTDVDRANDWYFAWTDNNGDLQGFAPRLHGSFRPVGDTDSERAFCWLMQELAKAHAAVPSVAELTHTLAELLPQPAAHGSFNCLLSNGQALWAHASTHLHWLERRHPFGAARLADEDLSVDFGALTRPGDRVALVATQPLTRGEDWVAMASGEMRVFVAGCMQAHDAH